MKNWSVVNVCVLAEEASVCVPRPVRRGTAGSRPPVNQHLSAGAQGKPRPFPLP